MKLSRHKQVNGVKEEASAVLIDIHHINDFMETLDQRKQGIQACEEDTNAVNETEKPVTVEELLYKEYDPRILNLIMPKGDYVEAKKELVDSARKEISRADIQELMTKAQIFIDKHHEKLLNQ